ncbi:MbnP family protein [candidate division KSB1 bacterium]
MKQKKNGHLIVLFVIIVSSILLSSIAKQDEGIPLKDYQITFKFLHKLGDEPVEFDTIKYVNTFGNKYSVATLKYFISNITLHKADGKSFLFDEDHYVDALDNSTISYTPIEMVPEGAYSQISFVFGLEADKNKTGRFVNPPKNRMEWPEGMGGGYHFMKLEGKYDSGKLIKSFQAHSGPLDGRPYYFYVTLKGSSFTIDGKDKEIEIIMDINKWWINPHTLDLNNITSIMGNHSVQQQLKENGADVFSVGSINNH